MLRSMSYLMMDSASKDKAKTAGDKLSADTPLESGINIISTVN